MVALLFFLLVSPFRSISRLEAENAALRRQLIVLQRQVRGRVQFANSDRLFFLQLYRWFPSIVKAMTTIRPETLPDCEGLIRSPRRHGRAASPVSRWGHLRGRAGPAEVGERAEET